MRILIVDDEAPARARLRRLLAGIGDVQVVGEAADAVDALRLVDALAPELLLLDVQMPGASGLDLAASLPDPAPDIVFVSAHDQYALQAFAVAALDYLLKPVGATQLGRALERHRRRSGIAGPLVRPAPSRLLIPDRGRTHVIALSDVLWLGAADNYVEVHTADRSRLLRRTLAAMLGDLGDGFVRCHRSAAVALAQVQAVQPRDNGDALVLLHGGQTVPCSRNHRAELMARLGGHAGR